MKNNTSRRAFINKTATLAKGLSMGFQTYSMGKNLVISGANDKIRMGYIGIGNRGSQLLAEFMKNKDVEIVALCDVYEPYLLRDRSKVDTKYLTDMAGQVPKMGENFPLSQPCTRIIESFLKTSISEIRKLVFN